MKLLTSIMVIILLLFLGNVLLSFGTHELGLMFGNSVPIINDSNLKVEELIRGLHLPIRIAFLGPNDILVIEKNNGTVSRFINWSILGKPLLDVNVANDSERGMLGIAVSKSHDSTYVFLYFTEADLKDGGNAVDNRLYRYELLNDKLVKPKLLLNLPVTPGPYHNGGALAIGPDGYVYLSVGDINGSCEEPLNNSRPCQSIETKAQNYQAGINPDGRAGILRITQDGKPIGNGIFGNKFPLNLYFAYGIRNSFGLDFDPVTGNLWDTENGPDYGDEINLVKSGFNSGWKNVQGIWKPNGTLPGNITQKPDNLVDFDGKGKYSKPEFTWRATVGPSAIAFVNTDKLGKQYENDILVGDVNNGNLYHYDLNKDRTGLILKGRLSDKVVDNGRENKEKDTVFGHHFGEITDVKVGPDGYIYIVVFSQQYGKVLRILPIANTHQ